MMLADKRKTLAHLFHVKSTWQLTNNSKLGCLRKLPGTNEAWRN